MVSGSSSFQQLPVKNLDIEAARSSRESSPRCEIVATGTQTWSQQVEEQDAIDAVASNIEAQGALGINVAEGLVAETVQLAATQGAVEGEVNKISSEDGTDRIEEVDSLNLDNSSDSEGDSPNDGYTTVKSKKQQKKERKREKKNKILQKKMLQYWIHHLTTFEAKVILMIPNEDYVVEYEGCGEYGFLEWFKKFLLNSIAGFSIYF